LFIEQADCQRFDMSINCASIDAFWRHVVAIDISGDKIEPGCQSAAAGCLGEDDGRPKGRLRKTNPGPAHLWLPTVHRMRADHPWDDIVRVLKLRKQDWTPERLRRPVKLVSEHMADTALLKRSPPRLPEDRLMTLVAGIAASNPTSRCARSPASWSDCMNARRVAAASGLPLRSRTCWIERRKSD
jgi:hypothetical protein